MIYPELATFDSTPEQDLALQIQMKQDPGTGASSPGDYLVKAAVVALLDGWVVRHVGLVITNRRKAAYDKATDQERAQVDAILKVDTVIVVDKADMPTADVEVIL